MAATREKLIAQMKRMNKVVKQDNAAGHQWRYYNGKRSEPTFAKTRAAGKYYTNCMGAVSFACKAAGVPASALQWYGGKNRIVWLNDHAKADAKKVFDIIPLHKAVKKSVRKGLIQPGDILTYESMSHTNAYYGDSLSFDTGHAFCTGSGEGAPFKKWIGTLAHSKRVVSYIFRIKGDYTYRVRVGEYNTKEEADRRVAVVFKKSGFPCFTERTDKYRVFCGSFKVFRNVIDRTDDLERAGVTQWHVVMM